MACIMILVLSAQTVGSPPVEVKFPSDLATTPLEAQVLIPTAVLNQQQATGTH